MKRRLRVVVAPQDQALTIYPPARLDASARVEFLNLFGRARRAPRCVVDFRDTEYVDSAGLGLLLLLRERCPNTILCGARPCILRILQIARFENYYEIAR